MEIKDILRQRRQQLKMTMFDVASKVGVSEGTVSRWESGDISNMRRDKIVALSNALLLSPSVLMGWEETEEDFFTVPANTRPVKHKRLPMLGNVACGEPIFANEEHDSFVDAAEDIDADFCLTAKGDSMINARIFDGDILFVKSQQTVDNGEIAVVLIDDEATVKRVYYDKEANTITLVPENPTHKVMRYSGSELNNVRIIGKVIVGQYEVE